MAETSRSDSSKLDPESLVLRANPRGVIRFKRGLLIGIAACVCLVIFGVTWLALDEGRLKPRQAGDELYNVGAKRPPDELAALPSSYDKIKPLGPPLPGDLGPSVVAREKSLGLSNVSLRPNPEDDAARAERMRLAQQARQANEASVFFQISKTGTSAAAATGGTASGGTDTGSSGTSLVANTANDQLNLDPDRDQNNQQRKIDFLSSKAEPAIYNPHALQQPVSPYEVLAGSILSASLITGLNSDLPGLAVAQVTENVYDSVTGGTLLIPQGSRLIGTYDSVVAFGQSRALLVWQRIVMPNGSSVQIDNLPATDKSGYSGLGDEVDYHTWTLLKGIAMSTLLGVGSQVTFGNDRSNLVEAIRQSTQESTNQAGQRIVEKNLNIQPTITVRPGWPLAHFPIFVTADRCERPFVVARVNGCQVACHMICEIDAVEPRFRYTKCFLAVDFNAFCVHIPFTQRQVPLWSLFFGWPRKPPN